MSLTDTYNDVCAIAEDNKRGFLALLEDHIDFQRLIPTSFYWAFYRPFGRPREYPLEGFVTEAPSWMLPRLTRSSRFEAV